MSVVENARGSTMRSAIITLMLMIVSQRYTQAADRGLMAQLLVGVA
jgi:hypothetical protein